MISDYFIDDIRVVAYDPAGHHGVDLLQHLRFGAAPAVHCGGAAHMEFQPISRDTFSLGPELVPWGPADEHLFAFAVGRDQALWYAQHDGYTIANPPGGWSAWQSLGGVVTAPPHAVRSGGSSVDVFAIGVASELLHWQFRDGSWIEQTPPLVATTSIVAPAGLGPTGEIYKKYWDSLGGILTSPPYAVAVNDQVVVFARGTDQALWNRTIVNGSWNDWISLGHILASRPHAAINRDGVLAVFALGTDSAIWYTMTTDSSSMRLSADWRSLGGTFSSAPFAVAWGAEFFVFGADAQSALNYCRWDGYHWSGWYCLGGILMSAPVASADPWGDIGRPPHVYALGTDSSVWRRTYSRVGDPFHQPDPLRSWRDWESIGAAQGGVFLSLPAATARFNPNSIDGLRELAALGSDHQVWHWEADQ